MESPSRVSERAFGSRVAYARASAIRRSVKFLRAHADSQLHFTSHSPADSRYLLHSSTFAIPDYHWSCPSEAWVSQVENAIHWQWQMHCFGPGFNITRSETIHLHDGLLILEAIFEGSVVTHAHGWRVEGVCGRVEGAVDKQNLGYDRTYLSFLPSLAGWQFIPDYICSDLNLK